TNNQPIPPIHMTQTAAVNAISVKSAPPREVPAASAPRFAPTVSTGADPMIPIRISVTGFPKRDIKEIAIITIAKDGPIELNAPVLTADFTSAFVIPTDELALDASLINLIA